MSFEDDHKSIRALYGELIQGWNHRDATRFAATLSVDANVVGFDGSQMKGRAEAEMMLGLIFSRFPTPPYVVLVKEVRFLTADAAVITSHVGMVPEGATAVNADLNAIQTLIAGRGREGWRFEVLQNTPAQFHGRPELKNQMTEELNRAAGKR